MAQAALVGNQLEDGQKFIERLTQDGFEVTAAAWVRKSADGLWFLYIAAPVVDNEGAINAYGRMQLAVAQMPQPFWIDRFEVKLIRATDPITRDILKAQGGRSSTIPIRYGGSRLGELPVEEAYIYPPLQPLAGGVGHPAYP